MTAPNQAQRQFWNDEAGPRWVALQDDLEEELGPLGRAVLDRLGVAPGARVLDVGCGCGATTLELARRAGAAGEVLGVDLSGPMLAEAERRLEAAGLTNVRFAQADAQVTPLPVVDVVFSRFGVMFFEDPVAAFANLRRALAPAGRLGFVCWRAPALNPLMNLAARAVAVHLQVPPPAPEGQAGPFAFADGERPRRVLEEAGFADVEVAAVEVPVDLARDVGSATAFFLQMGPGAVLLREAGAAPDVVERVAETLRGLLAPYVTPTGLRMPAAVWIVTARQSG